MIILWTEEAARYQEEQLAREEAEEGEEGEEEEGEGEGEEGEEKEADEGVGGLPKENDVAPGSFTDLVEGPGEPTGSQELIIKVQTIEHGPGDEIKITTEGDSFYHGC